MVSVSDRCKRLSRSPAIGTKVNSSLASAGSSVCTTVPSPHDHSASPLTGRQNENGHRAIPRVERSTTLGDRGRSQKADCPLSSTEHRRSATDISAAAFSKEGNGAPSAFGGSRRAPSGSAGSPVRWGKLSGRAKQQVDSAERERTTMTRATSLAEARLADAMRKKKYSYGDRLAYEAERANFDLLPNRVACFYAITCLSSGQVFIHGGQPSGANVIDPEMALASCSLWVTRGDHIEEEELDPISNISPLIGHSAVCYKGSRVIVYGGCGPLTAGLFSDVYAFNVKTRNSAMILTSTPQPPGRARHAAAIWKHFMLIHGGHCHRSGNRVLDDLWALDIPASRWTKLPSTVVNEATLAGLSQDEAMSNSRGPLARYGHHIAVYQDYMYLALGSGASTGFADIWAYDLKGQFWNYVTPQGRLFEPRIDCASCVYGNERWLFHGGFDNNCDSMLNSFLEFNFRTHEARQLRVELRVAPLKILPALKGHGMVSVREADGEEVIYIFGGSNRMEAVVRVIYVVRDTQKAPGVCRREAEFPPMARPSSRESPRYLMEFPPVNKLPSSRNESDEEGDLLTRANGLPSREVQLEAENAELRERLRLMELKLNEWQSNAGLVLDQTECICEKMKELLLPPSAEPFSSSMK